MKLNQHSARARFTFWSLLCLPLVWAVSMACMMWKKKAALKKPRLKGLTLKKPRLKQSTPEEAQPTRAPLRERVQRWPVLAQVSQRLTARRSATPPVNESGEMSKMTDLIDHNIETIISLHMHAELKVDHHQRLLEHATAQLGRPRSFYLVLIAVVCWVVSNLFAPRLGLRIFDPAPFAWLQGIVGLGALLMTILVLTTQNRQAKMAERRKHLDLQVNLIVEHKVSKLIALVEELRRDTPSVKDREDQEAEAMTEAVDPQAMFLALDETLEEANKEVEQALLQSDVVVDLGAVWSIGERHEPSSETHT